MKSAVIISSKRGPQCLENFLEFAPDNVDFIVISKEKMEKKYDKTTEFNDKEASEKSWIFNRVTNRNFGFLYAYKQNYDVIITLDDDCFPTSKTFFDDHINKLKSSGSDHFSTLSAFSNIPEDIFEKGARGFPSSFEKYPIVLNQGLWIGDLDLPATTIGRILKSADGKIPPPLSTESKVVNDFVLPKGQLATFCGMNVSFLREVLPALPWTYQDPDVDRVSRYDDIWAGLIVKIILDKLDKRMSTGSPVIRHTKGKRDIEKDIEYEIKGDTINSYLWNNLSSLVLEGNNYESCFLEVANWLDKSSENPDLIFLKKVSKAMHEWIMLLNSPF